MDWRQVGRLRRRRSLVSRPGCLSGNGQTQTALAVASFIALSVSTACTVPSATVLMARQDGGGSESSDAQSADFSVAPDVQDGGGPSFLDSGIAIDSSITGSVDSSSPAACQCSTNQVCVANSCVANWPNSIAVGGNHTCVLASGEVFCWGSNSNGELGIPIDSTKKRTSPVAVPDLTGVKQLAAGSDFTCALMSNGKVNCWGDNSSGQLGSSGQSLSPSPLEVPGLPSAMWISAGLDFACVVASADHTVWCWGNNTIGQLGRSASTSPGAPSVVDKVTEASSVVAGTDFACVVSSGLISCWGGNHWGQLGDGTTTPRTTPASVVGGLTNAVQVVASGSILIPDSIDGPTACARLADGKVACWGDNLMGTLGDPSNSTSYSVQPVYVAALEGVSEIAAGSDFFCTIVAQGSVKCWGSNTSGQLGPQVTGQDASATATPVQNLNNVTHLSAGTSHACALLGTGSVYCWGYNSSGQLGDGTTVKSATPVQASQAPRPGGDRRSFDPAADPRRQLWADG